MANGEHIEVAKAFVTIVPSLEGSQRTITEELTGVTSEASEKAGAEGGSKFGNKFASAIKGTTAVIGAAMAAATGAAIATGKAFVSAANDVSQYGNNVDKMSQKMGISAQAYQEWDFIMQHAGANIEGMKTSMLKLTKAAESGDEAFAALGISQEQLASMNQEEIFSATIKGLQDIQDEGQRTVLANKLLGKGAVELAPLLNMSSSEIDNMREQVHELGGVMSDDAVKAAATYQDELQNMNTALDGVKKNMVSKFLPGMSQVMNGLSKVFSGNGGIEEIRKGLENVVGNISALAPQFLSLASVIINSIIAGFGPMLPQLVSSIFSFLTQGLLTITSMVPQLAPVIVEGIKGVATALFSALPVLVQALIEMSQELVLWLSSGNNVKIFIDGILQLVSILAEGLADSLPILLPAIVNIIGQIADSLTDPKNVNMILKSILYIVGAIVVALVKALPEIGGVVVQLSLNITNQLKSWGEGIIGFFTGLWTRVKEGAAQGLENLKEKFRSIFETVKNTVKSGIDKIKSFFKFEWSLPKIKLPHFKISGSFSLNPPKVPSFGISWYAKAMNEPLLLNGATIFGMNNGKLLGGGEAGSEMIVGTNKLMEMMRAAVGDGQPININVYGAEGQDVNELAEMVAYKLEDLKDRKERVWK